MHDTQLVIINNLKPILGLILARGCDAHAMEMSSLEYFPLLLYLGHINLGLLGSGIFSNMFPSKTKLLTVLNTNYIFVLLPSYFLV